jgi:flagellar motor switch protein FliN/FliY
MAETITALAFIDGLVGEFSTAIESVLGATVAVTPTTGGEGAGWIIRFALTGDLQGPLAIWIGAADATRLAQRVLGMDEPPDGPTVIDMLREMWTQASSAVALKDPFTGVKADVGTPEAGEPSPDPLGGCALDLGDGAAITLSLAGHMSVATAPPAVAKPAAAGSSDATDASAKLELVLDIDLPLVVRFGRTSMSLKALAELGPGSIVDMGRSPDEPVEMLVGNRVLARGEVVVVGGHYGVRIMDLVSPAERARAMES